MLKEFYAVTEDYALWHVIRDEEEKEARIIKIDQPEFKLKESKELIGYEISTTSWRNGVAIVDDKGLMRYCVVGPGEHQKTPYSNNSSHWGVTTERIVALFVDKERAIRLCHDCTSVPWCWHFIEPTMEVLTQITEDDDVFMLDDPVKEMIKSIDTYTVKAGKARLKEFLSSVDWT